MKQRASLTSIFVFSCLTPETGFSATNINSAGSLSEWTSSFIEPNLPGALLLLALSAAISTLTFYSNLKRSSITSKGSLRFLMLWMFGNYIFALLLLMLILPQGQGLNEVDRTLLLYCIVAVSMPELSAYLKIQLGNSERGINLYKLRETFVNYVSRSVGTLSVRGEWQEIQLLKEAYFGLSEQLDEKLTAFANICHFPNEEKPAILACLPSANENNVDKSVDKLMVLGDEIQNMVFEYFNDDIRRYQASSRARLIRTLYPPISVTEADNLVRKGILTPFRFFLETIQSSRRNALSNVTRIDGDRLALIHNEMKAQLHARFKRQLVNILGVIVFITVALLIVGTEMEKSLTPSNIVMESEHPLQ